MSNKDRDKIQRISGKFRKLFTVLTICIPVITCLYWILFNYLPVGLTADLPVQVQQPISLTTQLLAFAVSLVPMSVALYGVIYLKKLFGLYENAIVFSEQNVKCIRRLGYTLIYWVVSTMVFTVLISLVLTFNQPPGERTLVASFGISDLSTLIIAAVVVLVSWVMNEAVKLENEQAYTV